MRVFLLTLLVVGFAAADKNPKPQPAPPTEEQMRAAYASGARILTATATNPAAIRLDPIKAAWFRLDHTKRGEFVTMWLGYYRQNVYGATVRSMAMCAHWVRGTDPFGNPADCVSGDNDAIALGMIPKGMVQITEGVGTAPSRSDEMTSISIQSSPTEALVEVDGYPAGHTPVDVKLQRGEYTLRVSKAGYKTWTQKLVVEPGQAQTVGITLAEVGK